MLLTKRTLFVKEHVSALKLTGTYDILDPETNAQIGLAKEEPGNLVKYSRLFLNKQMLPNKINIYNTLTNTVAVSIVKPFTIFRSKVQVRDKDNQQIGYLVSKVITIGGGFKVFDINDKQVAEVKGDWKGWNFKLVDMNKNEMGTVTKKWAGLGKELFTTADNYVISINESLEIDEKTNTLLLAAALAIDTIYKETK